MESIIGILNNSDKFKEALLKPHPSERQRKSLQKELLVVEDCIEKIQKKEINLINKLEEGVRLNGLQERADKLNKDKKEQLKRREEIKSQLSSSPTDKEIKSCRKLMLKQIEKLDLNNLSYEEQRGLIKMFCQGRNEYFGRPNGIYIGKSEGELAFNLEGIIGSTIGYISDKDPDLDVFDREDSVDVEQLRSSPFMDDFNKRTGTDG